MTLCDAGVLIGLADSREAKSSQCREAVRNASIPLVTTWPCITEAMHLLGRRKGSWAIQHKLARQLLNRFIVVYELSQKDCERLFTLMAQYQDRPMDLADASLVLAAEKTGERQILTLDSDFFFYRIDNRDSFDILEI
jgi:uncharacterized protein